MTETPQEYVARVLRNIEGKDPIKVQSATVKKLDKLIRNQAPSSLRKRPAPGKWSLVEILAHMAETEFAAAWRIRQALSLPGITLQAFDQDAWANTGHYDKRPATKWVECQRRMKIPHFAGRKFPTPEVHVWASLASDAVEPSAALMCLIGSEKRHSDMFGSSRLSPP